MVFGDDAYGFITCYVPVLKTLAKKSPQIVFVNLHVFTCLV